MNVSKKLLLMTIAILGLQATVHATNEDTRLQRVFDFAISLRQQHDNADALALADLLEEEALSSRWIYTDSIIVVIDAPLTLEEKITYLLKAQNKQREERAREKSELTFIRPTKSELLKRNIQAFAAVSALAATLPALITISQAVGNAIAPKIIATLISA